MALTRTYTSSQSLPILAPGPGESAIQLFRRRVAAAEQIEQRSQASYSSIINKFEQAQEKARQANIKRQGQITSIFDRIAQMYQPGGALEKRYLSELERRKTKGVGTEMQHMISSGLYGTTTAAGAGRRWEAEVGEPARLKLEDIMQQRYGEALGTKAGFLERIEEPYPDYGLIAQLIMSGQR